MYTFGWSLHNHPYVGLSLPWLETVLLSSKFEQKKQNIAHSRRRTSGERLSKVRLLSHCEETPWHHDPLSWVNVGHWNHETTTLFRMWVGSMTLEHVNFIWWAPQQNRNVYVLFIHQAELGNMGGGILLALYVGITIHPSNICTKHCSSQYDCMELLSIS